VDPVVGALVKEGGAWLTVAVLLVILAATVKAAWELLKREWARGDRQDAVIAQLVGSTEKLLDGQLRLERQLDGIRPRTR
jgi:hypothetical protein